MLEPKHFSTTTAFSKPIHFNLEPHSKDIIMRNSHVFAAVLAAALSATPVLADSYRFGDAAPAMGALLPSANWTFGFGALGTDGWQRDDRRFGDTAPSVVLNPGSVSAPGNVASKGPGFIGGGFSPRWS